MAPTSNALRFVIIGGGPAGTQAATVAARLGAEVTLIERDVIGGAAHLWDCIPSKAMIATGAAFGEFGEAAAMGLRPGDRLLEIDGRPVADIQAILAAFERNTGPRIAMVVERGRERLSLSGRFPPEARAGTPRTIFARSNGCREPFDFVTTSGTSSSRS